MNGLKGRGETAKAPKVNACLGLVENHQIAALGQDCSDFNALELAAGQTAVNVTVNIFSGT